jgi:Flp pilus assembly pilin Flp
LLSAYVHARIALLVLVDSLRQRDERGQTSAEYALVLLGAAAIALLIVAWATKTDLIGKLFDAVVNAITGKVDD